jgi:hypothetical protein
VSRLDGRPNRPRLHLESPRIASRGGRASKRWLRRVATALRRSLRSPNGSPAPREARRASAGCACLRGPHGLASASTRLG